MNVVGIEQTVRAQPTAPGAPFETAVEDVLGVPMRVFKHRARSLRELLIDSAKHGDAEYLVDGGNRISYIMLEFWCRDTLATYKVPKELHFVPHLEKTASGKVRRWKDRPSG